MVSSRKFNNCRNREPGQWCNTYLQGISFSCGLLMIFFQEIRQTFSHGLNFFHRGQENDAKVVRCWPVESSSLHHQYLFLDEKIQEKLLVIMNIVHLDVYFRKKIEGPHGFHTGNSRYCAKALIGSISLFVDTHGLTPVALKIKRQMQLPFIYLFLKLNVSFYDFFVYANGR